MNSTWSIRFDIDAPNNFTVELFNRDELTSIIKEYRDTVGSIPAKMDTGDDITDISDEDVVALSYAIKTNMLGYRPNVYMVTANSYDEAYTLAEEMLKFVIVNVTNIIDDIKDNKPPITELINFIKTRPNNTIAFLYDVYCNDDAIESLRYWSDSYCNLNNWVDSYFSDIPNYVTINILMGQSDYEARFNVEAVVDEFGNTYTQK